MLPRTALLCVVTASLSTGWVDAKETARPNILFLFSDDQQAATLSAYGHPDVKTPHLDSLVRRGCSFRRTYIQGSDQPAVCVPSRAAMLTGKGLWQKPGNFGPEHVTWIEAFRKQGYATHGIGKWHNGPPSYARAFSSGDDMFFGGMQDHFGMKLWEFNPAGKYPPNLATPREGHSSTLFANAAIDFLQHHPREQPFCLYVAFSAPHDPRTPPSEFRKMYDPAKLTLPPNFAPRHPFNNGEMTIRDEMLAGWPRTSEVVREHLADYYGMISHMDAEIGRVLAELNRLELAENTIVVFAADNGLAIGQHGLLGKQNLYEHSIKVPLVVALPKEPQPGRQVSSLNYLFDIGPTLCELAGVNAPAGMTGRSLVPQLRGSSTAQPRAAVLTAYRDGQRAVVTERWKLIRYPRVDRTQLFDLESDPWEMRDLAGEVLQLSRVADLRATFESLQREWGDKLPWTSRDRDPDQIDLPPKR